MTVATRVIALPRWDAGRVVKGNFANLRDAGDPVELARSYDAQGVDELTFDVTASSGRRETTYDVVRRTAEQVFIPLTVGGGSAPSPMSTRCFERERTRSGSTRRRSPAPVLIAEIADRFGAQVLVPSADVRRRRGPDGQALGGFVMTTHGARWRSTSTPSSGARAAELGAGEILLNSMDADGTKDGFDLELIAAVRAEVAIPVIASGERARWSTSRRRCGPGPMRCWRPASSTSAS